MVGVSEGVSGVSEGMDGAGSQHPSSSLNSLFQKNNQPTLATPEKNLQRISYFRIGIFL